MVRKVYSDEQFVALTRELTETLRRNRTIDWRHKESARAQMRVMVKRLLKKYKYPPEGAEEALQMVMAQCDNWVENEDFNETTDENTPAPTATILSMKPYGDTATSPLPIAAEQAEEYGRE
jgi:hypothetical protein